MPHSLSNDTENATMIESQVTGTDTFDSIPRDRSTSVASNSLRSLSFRTLSLRSSFYSVAPEFQRQNSQQGFTCQACSYQNPPSGSSICSICGTNRHGTPQSSGSSLTPLTEAPKEQRRRSMCRAEPDVGCEKPIVGKKSKSKLVPSKFSRVLDSRAPLPIPENNRSDKHPSSTASNTREIRENNSETIVRPPVKKPSVKAKLSFARWTNRENQEWVCEMCTYVNEDPLHLTCAICGQARGHKPVATNEPHMSRESSSSTEEDQQLFLERQRQLSEEAALVSINKERWNEFVEDQKGHLEEIQTNHVNVLDSCEEDMKKLLSDQDKSQEDVQRTLDKCARDLSDLESIQAEEKREQQVMEAVQQQRRNIIEQEEGRDAFEQGTVGGSQRGVMRKRTMVWVAQQRMLDDWRENLDSRQSRMDSLWQLQDEIGKSFRNTSKR